MRPVIRSYLDFYTDLSNDPNGQDYEAMSDAFHVPVGANPQLGRDELHRRIYEASDQNTPMAFAILIRRENAEPDDPGLIHVIHRASRKPATLGGPVTPWDDGTYAIANDVVGTAYTVVEFGDLNTENVPTIRVLSDEALTQQLAANVNMEVVGPLLAAANTMNVRTRVVTFIPFRYVPLFLAGPMKPREAWERVSTAIEANGHTNACRSLLTWLKVACTRVVAGEGFNNNLAHPWDLLDRVPDANLLSFFNDRIQRDIPDLFGPAQRAGTQGADPQLLAHLGNLAMEQRQTRIEAAARQQRQVAPKSVEDVWGTVGAETLVRMSQVMDTFGLPPVYGALAAAPKRQRHSVLQDFVTEMGRTLQVVRNIVLPHGITEMIMKNAWHSPDNDDLSAAINPFVFGPITAAEEVQMRQRIEQASLVYSNEANISMSDAQVLAAPPDVRMPTDWFSFQFALEDWWVFLATIFPAGHPQVQFAHDQHRFLQRNLFTFIRRDMPPLAPAWAQRYYQSAFNLWASVQMSTSPAVPISATDIMTQVALGNMAWAPPVPVRYLQRSVRPPAVAAPPAQHPLPRSGPPPPPAGQQPAPAGPAPAGDNQNSTLNNPHHDSARYQAIRDRRVATRVIKLRIQNANDRLTWPTRPDGQRRCLAWHIVGRCNARCGLAFDHTVNPLPAAEADAIHQWATDHWLETE